MDPGSESNQPLVERVGEENQPQIELPQEPDHCIAVPGHREVYVEDDDVWAKRLYIVRELLEPRLAGFGTNLKEAEIAVRDESNARARLRSVALSLSWVPQASFDYLASWSGSERPRTFAWSAPSIRG